MGINAEHVVFKSLDQIDCVLVRFDRNSWVFALGPVETDKKDENRTDSPVPMRLHRRYYSYSKPGGPLSQDTHTSSGLSIYGLGVGT
jgi:hypothetical protein